MTLLADWRRIIKRAWSVRLGALAFIFEGAGLLLPLFIGDMPRHLFAILSIVALAGAGLARVTKQKEY